MKKTLLLTLVLGVSGIAYGMDTGEGEDGQGSGGESAELQRRGLAWREGKLKCDHCERKGRLFDLVNPENTESVIQLSSGWLRDDSSQQLQKNYVLELLSAYEALLDSHLENQDGFHVDTVPFERVVKTYQPIIRVRGRDGKEWNLKSFLTGAAAGLALGFGGAKYSS